MLYVRKHQTFTSGSSPTQYAQSSKEHQFRPIPEIWYGSGKRRYPVGAGCPTGEDLGSVEPLRDKNKQSLAPTDPVCDDTGRDYKPGLLIATAIVKGFVKPWSILIDSGASCNYARRLSLENSQQYVEALKAHVSDTITVRLATGTCVTVPEVPLNLNVKFLDFDSVERCLVLDLDSRYDLILGMAWLERHEPWID